MLDDNFWFLLIDNIKKIRNYQAMKIK